MAPKKIRCSFKDCRDAAQRIVGDCGFCEGHFCAKHRLLEDHKCTGLEDVSSTGGPDFTTTSWWMVGLAEVLSEDSSSYEQLANMCGDLQCKKQSHERNAAQLEAERTQVIRGV